MKNIITSAVLIGGILTAGAAETKSANAQANNIAQNITFGKNLVITALKNHSKTLNKSPELLNRVIAIIVKNDPAGAADNIAVILKTLSSNHSTAIIKIACETAPGQAAAIAEAAIKGNSKNAVSYAVAAAEGAPGNLTSIAVSSVKSAPDQAFAITEALIKDSKPEIKADVVTQVLVVTPEKAQPQVKTLVASTDNNTPSPQNPQNSSSKQPVSSGGGQPSVDVPVDAIDDLKDAIKADETNDKPSSPQGY